MTSARFASLKRSTVPTRYPVMPDTLELHTLACLPAFNAESIPRPA